MTTTSDCYVNTAVTTATIHSSCIECIVPTEPWYTSVTCSKLMEGGPTMSMKCWQVCVSCICLFFFHAAEEVLNEFYDQFLKEVDANAVVYVLQKKSIISQGDQAQILRIDSDRQKNQHLHQCLVKKCTSGALIDACKIFIAEAEGNQKMKAFGDSMLKRLEPGKS